MGFFRRLLGGRRDEGRDDPEVALAELEAVRERATRDPRGAASQLRHAGRRHRNAFAVQGSQHDLYRAAYEALHGPVPPRPEDVAVVRWESLGEDPSLRALTMRLDRTRAPYVLVTPEDDRADSGAGGQLEALALLAADASVALVLAGDLDLVLRRSFLDALSVPAHLLDASEVIVELSDLAAAAGLQARTVPA